MTDTPMANPQLTCDHHYISYHQNDFPDGIYWVRICDLCRHILPEIADRWLVIPRAVLATLRSGVPHD